MDMKKITFDIEDQEYTKLEKQAKSNERSVSAELRVIVKESLK